MPPDNTTKLRMVFDRELPAEARAFAALECLSQPVSFATLGTSYFDALVKHPCEFDALTRIINQYSSQDFNVAIALRI